MAVAGDFSRVPELPGLIAAGGSLTVFEFTNMARQEFYAAGTRVALHPRVGYHIYEKLAE